MKQTRREFLKTTAVSAGTVSLAGRHSVLGAGNRIRLGMIGVGGMGTSHLRQLVENAGKYNCDVVAVCDVYRRRLKRAQGLCKCDTYMDYHDLLGRDDIDAVLIATPDHWHSTITIDAMKAGKHVYVEKPMTLTIEQALEVRDATKKYKKVVQVGPQRTSDDKVWKAKQAITEGRVGKVTWAQGGYNRNIRGGAFNVWFPIDKTAGPDKSGDDYIDWDRWLGHKLGLAPKIPWNPEHYFRFRKYWPYNGGVATDLLYHILAPIQLAVLGVKGEYPYRVSANGGLYLLKDGRDIPDVFIMNVDYESGFTANLISVLTNNSEIPFRIFGRYGTVEIGEQLKLVGNGDFVKEFGEQNQGYTEVSLATDERPDMKENFFNVIRNGGTTYCNVDLGTTTMVAIKMAVESYRQNRMLIWDAEKEQIVT